MTVIFVFGIKSYVTTFAVQFTISQAGIAALTLTLTLALLPEPPTGIGGVSAKDLWRKKNLISATWRKFPPIDVDFRQVAEMAEIVN